MLSSKQAPVWNISPCVEIISVAPPGSAKTKKAKSPFKPKHPKTPNKYFLFCKKRRTELHALYPNITSREVTKILANEWKSMSQEQQESYAEMYAQMMETNNTREQESANAAIPLWIDIPTATGEMMRVAAYYRKE